MNRALALSEPIEFKRRHISTIFDSVVHIVSCIPIVYSFISRSNILQLSNLVDQKYVVGNVASSTQVSLFLAVSSAHRNCSCNREWVAKCLSQITDSNRAEVQAELKQVISEAFSAHTLWTTDWAGVQLKR
jgi:hypothetical protein